MKKLIEAFVLIILIVTLVVLINDKFFTYKSYKFELENGELVQVQLKIKGGYMFDGDNFEIYNSTSKKVNGIFITDKIYNDILELLTDNMIVEKNNDYIIYNLDDEYTLVLLVKGSDSALKLSSESLDDLKECYNRLTISLVTK